MNDRLAFLEELEEELKKVEELVHEIEAPVINLKSANDANETEEELFVLPDHEKVNSTWTCEAKHHTCVRFFEEYKHWKDAQKHCHLHKSHLARIYDENYLHFLDTFRNRQRDINGFNASAWPEGTLRPEGMEPVSAYSEFWVYYNDIKKDSEGNYRIDRWNVNDGTNKTHDFRRRRQADDEEEGDPYPADNFLNDGSKGNNFDWDDIDEQGMWADDDPNSLDPNDDDCVYLNKDLKLGDTRCDIDEKFFICQTLPRNSVFHVYHQVFSEECNPSDPDCDFFRIEDIIALRNNERCETVDSDDCFIFKGPSGNRNNATSWLNMKPFRYLENQGGLYFKMQWTPGFDLSCNQRSYECVEKKHGHFITWYQEENPFTNTTSPDTARNDDERDAINNERARIFPQNVTFFPGKNFEEIFGGEFKECDGLAFNGLGFGMDQSSLFTGILNYEQFYQVGATTAFRAQSDSSSSDTVMGFFHIATINNTDGCPEDQIGSKGGKKGAKGRLFGEQEFDTDYNWGKPVHGIDLWISKMPFPSQGTYNCTSDLYGDYQGFMAQQNSNDTSAAENFLAFTCRMPPPPKVTPPPTIVPEVPYVPGAAETLGAAAGGALGGSLVGTLAIKAAPKTQVFFQEAAKGFALWLNKKFFAMPEMKTKSTAYHPEPKKPKSHAKTQYLDPSLLIEEHLHRQGFKKYLDENGEVENQVEIDDGNIPEEVAISDTDINEEDVDISEDIAGNEDDDDEQEEHDGKPLLKDFSTNIDLLDYVDFHDWEDDTDEMEQKVYVDVEEIEKTTEMAKRIGELDRACEPRCDLIHEYDGELIDEAHTLLAFLTDKSKTFKEILADVEEQNSSEREEPGSEKLGELFAKYPGLSISRLHDKSTSTPVELIKALKKTAGEISGPLGSNKIDLMKKAASLAGIKVPKNIEGTIKTRAKDFLLKISVDLVQKVNTKLLPVEELEQINFDRILFPPEKFDAQLQAYMYPDQETQPFGMSPTLPGFWVTKKLNTKEDLRTHMVKINTESSEEGSNKDQE